MKYIRLFSILIVMTWLTGCSKKSDAQNIVLGPPTVEVKVEADGPVDFEVIDVKDERFQHPPYLITNGKLKSLIVAGSNIELQDHTVKEGLLETKEFGKLKILLSQEEGQFLYVTKEQVKSLTALKVSGNPEPDSQLKSTNVITVSGRIVNLKETDDCIAKDSYLQLVSLPPDGSLNGTTDSQGRATLNSDLPKINFPEKDGKFLFEVNKLVPGKYFVAAQLLESGDEIIFFNDSKKPNLFEVDSQAKRAFDLGDLLIKCK